MADTQRTRAQLLALFADNVTGQISAQDLRDFLVTMMEEEFANPGDFWKMPNSRFNLTDKTAKGWWDYSQVAGSDISSLNVVYMNVSGIWKKADLRYSAMTGILGLTLDSFTSNASNMPVLRRGMVYWSAYSATFSNFVGKPVYLASGTAGAVTMTKTTNSVLIVGWVEASDDGGAAIGKFRFEPNWAITGT